MGLRNSHSIEANKISTRQRRKARRRDQLKQVLRRTGIEQCEPRNLFAVAPQLVAIIPNVGDALVEGQTRNEAPREFVIQFDNGQRIDEASAQNGGIQILRSGSDGNLGTIDDVDVTPRVANREGWIGVGDRPNEIVVRFTDQLIDDKYQIRIIGSGLTPLSNLDGQAFNNGVDVTRQFELDLGARIVAVVPQPIERLNNALVQARNEIEVYFNDDDLNVQSATDPAFYQLIRTRSTADNLDDGAAISPISVTYDPVANKARLVFSDDLASLDATETAYRLRIGNRYSQPLAPIVRTQQETGEAADTFAGAVDINQQIGAPALGAQTVIVQGQIRQVTPYNLDLPGGNNEPGHRDLPDGVDAPHLGGPDATPGIRTIFYNFRDDYGFDPQGNPLFNLITPAQKQRAREVFAYYSEYLGVQFVETANQGFTIVTGDLRALDPSAPPGAVGLAGGSMAIMDSAENWGSSEAGGGWFGTAMHEIGHLLGQGHTYDLPPSTMQGSDGTQGGGQDPSYPGDHDIVHGQYLHRPESTDIDVYRFTLDRTGVFRAETVAERLGASSPLDTVVWVYNSSRELVARNDDYFSEDSFIELELQPGDYYVAVTSTGMSEINPKIAESGFGGTSEGSYELRLDFKPSPDRNPTAASGIVDSDGQPTLLDGDADGRPGGEYNFWFTAASLANTLFVDKSAGSGGDGSLATPFNNINAAFQAASTRNNDADVNNDIRVVRIVGNGGADGDLLTQADNFAYEIGFNNLGQSLADGATMQVPRGVTVMVDAGALFRLRRANIDVGSKAQGADNSAADNSRGHLQVLGTPDQSVFFTSYNSRPDQPETPRQGDWGGIVFRNEIDNDARRDRVLENQGIFINYVNHADFRYGGGEVLVNGVLAPFSPIHLNEARPALTFNRITDSARGAVAADPNSFAEDLFSNIGHDFVQGRVTVAASVVTLTGGTWPSWATSGRSITISGQAFTVASRLSDTQLQLSDPGVFMFGPRDFVLSPAAFTADYRRVGPEIYDNDLVNNTINGLFIQIDTLAGQILDRLEVSARFDDTDIAHVLSESLVIAGTPGGASIQPGGTRFDARLDGRLTIDPAIVVKLDNARIETEMGAELIAEGQANNRVVFTSLLDLRYGGRGTFATTAVDLGSFSQGTINAIGPFVSLLGGGIWPAWAAGATLTINGTPYTVLSRDSDTTLRLANASLNVRRVPFELRATRTPAPGDWAGLVFGPLSQGSLDHALITYGGGTSAVEGGFASFNAVEIQQADVRLTNSLLERNDGGRDFPRGIGRFSNDDAVIYVRAAQPVIVNNLIRDNAASPNTSVISINVNALNSDAVHDLGRSRGALGRTGDFVGNRGPLVRNNRLSRNSINGMEVRGSTLTTQSVWDDVDIVHVLRDEVLVQNHHIFSGLRLQSSATQSLVVKLDGPNAGLTAAGIPLDIDDRIGGSVLVQGTPGRPVVMTSLFDSSVGAGPDEEGRLQTNTASSAFQIAGPGDWRSIRLERYSNDRNVALFIEREEGNSNGQPSSAESIGQLASAAQLPGADPTLLGPGERGGDDNRRLGFEVQGRIATPGDVDVYTFKGRAGQEVWLDIDRTTYALDSVIELVDASGAVLARSNDSGVRDQTSATQARVYPLQKDPLSFEDLYTTNPRDAGMRVVLPGPANSLADYYVRISSNGGETSGVYQLQVRLREIDEVPGSTVQTADIRYATTGIELLGVPGHSPLLGEGFETTALNDDQASSQDLGNVLRQERGAISVGGDLANFNDVDWYRITVDWQNIQDIPNPLGDFDDTASVIFDFDYADGAGRPDTNFAVFDDTGRLIYMARNSNIADDQPSTGAGSDKGDLSRGSFGEFDPYLGPIQLRENNDKTYFLAVSSDSNLPEVLNNPSVRIEPILAQDRLYDDRLGSSWVPAVAGRPTPQRLFPTAQGQSLDSYADPWQLGDVVLFVQSGTRLWTVDPFTGAIDSDVGSTGNNAYIDLGMRTDGRLLGMLPNGNTVEISTADASGTGVGDDGIGTNPNYAAFTVYDQGNDRIIVAIDTSKNLYLFNANTGTTDEQVTGTDNDPLVPITGLPAASMPTGLANVGGVIYGVTNAGDFFRVNPSTGAATRIGTPLMMPNPANPAQMIPIPFTGLARGPQNVENGAYANTLFATDSQGNLHALELFGSPANRSVRLAPIFVDGKTQVPTNLTGLTGLSFSTLDYNLWHSTSNRGSEVGHGLEPTPDGEASRLDRIEGGTSYWFGLEQNSNQPGVGLYQSNPNNLYSTYNLPGGAHGTLTTDTFSLAGYDFGDAPTFYFTYRAEHDTSLDSFRVHVSNDGASWTLVGQTPVPAQFQDVNPWESNLVNDAQWRQARIDLSPFAGLDNLRIRFDFNTLGGRDVGMANSTGTPLGAVPGSEIFDGDSFSLLDTLTLTPTVFEFDMGFGVQVPNGAALDIQDGDTVTITGGAGPVTFEFDTLGDGVAGASTAIVITPADTADTVAAAIEAAITAAQISGVTVRRAGQRIGLEGATDVQQTGIGLFVEGDAPGTLTDPTAVPIVIHAAMTAEEVAVAIAEALDAHYVVTVNQKLDVANLFTSVKVDRDAIYVIGKNIDVLNSGPLAIPFTGGLPGDYRMVNPQRRAEQGRDNAFEGIYLDDFVIGFAERGEIISGAPVDTTYLPETANQRPDGKVLEGAYQFEIRRGFEHGVATFSTQDPYILNLTRGFAANDRFADGITITAPEPALIVPGSTFTIDDGVNRRTYEFNLTGDPGSITAGNISVNVAFALTAADVARAMSQAINNDPILLTTATLDFGSTTLHLARAAAAEGDVVVTVFDDQDMYGDQNIFRDQGQILIHNNFIRDSSGLGIQFDAGVRDPGSNLPHPGAVRNLIDFNTARLAPSVSIANNVIANSGVGGISFSGDAGGDPLGAVPFGRIYNNTIYGGDVPRGFGIGVTENASPTLLNNVLANLATGVQVDASSSSTQIGSTVYHRNSVDAAGTSRGALAIRVPPTEDIFVDALNDNFYPSAGSRLIDSARDSLEDRIQLTSISNPIGIPASPILSPDRDIWAQDRVDDPSVSNTGLGQNPFKDRGALERADFSGPTAVLLVPDDNDPAGRDLDPAENFVRLGVETLTSFRIQLVDEVLPLGAAVGIDDVTVFDTQFSLFRDGALLRLGTDYDFSYDPYSNIVEFKPATGTWAADRVYVIELNNSVLSGIKDVAGNALSPNELSGLTRFTIRLDAADFGDAPSGYPTRFIEQGGQAGAYHIVLSGLQLGPTVTSEEDGQPSPNADADSGDDGVVFVGGLLPGDNAQVAVNVVRTGLAPNVTTYLNGWIDFNRDGDWNDAGEQVFTNTAVVAGANSLNISVPVGATPGASFARFRLSTQQNLAPTGAAVDGEVEDYQVDILPLVRYELQLNYANSATELFRDSFGRYSVSPGLEVTAAVYVEDLRAVNAAGVQQAFADLVYSNDLIDWATGSLSFGPLYTAGQTGTVDDNATPQVDEAGATAPTETGFGRQLLFQVTGTIKDTAQPESNFTVTVDPADTSPDHDTRLFNVAEPVNAAYDSEAVVVKARAWQNAISRFDVNADGLITARDALTVINRLNTVGPGPLDPTPNAPDIPQPFYDVNGDGNLTALDALNVINRLNTVGPGPVGGSVPAPAPQPVLAAAGSDPVPLVQASHVVAAASSNTFSAGNGTPLASSFDVTAVAMSNATSGSTAVAPALARAVTASDVAVRSALLDDTIERLFSGDETGGSQLAYDSAPVVDELVESLVLDDRFVAAGSVAVHDTIAVGRDADEEDELDALLEALGFGSDA